jgi:hypothetical protein
MTEGLKVVERTNSTAFSWRSTKRGSFNTDVYECTFHSFSVWYNFCKCFVFLNRRGPPTEEPRTTVWETIKLYQETMESYRAS